VFLEGGDRTTTKFDPGERKKKEFLFQVTINQLCRGMVWDGWTSKKNLDLARWGGDVEGGRVRFLVTWETSGFLTSVPAILLALVTSWLLTGAPGFLVTLGLPGYFGTSWFP